MRLTNQTFLAAEASCAAVEITGHSITKVEQLELHAPEKIDVNAGPSRGSRHNWGCGPLGDVGESKDLLFKVYAIKLHRDEDRVGLTNIYDDSNIIREGVPLQRDPKVDKDCYLYSYSANPDVRGKPQAIRTFSKYAVTIKSCTLENKCKFSFLPVGERNKPEVGRICPLLNDAGAPIICGGKVSFVTGKYPHDLCTSRFMALKIAPYYSKIMQYRDHKDYRDPTTG